MSDSIHPDALRALLDGDNGAPASILGKQRSGDQLNARAFRPWAAQIELVCLATGERLPMRRMYAGGLFSAELDASWSDRLWRYESVTTDGERETFGDAYLYPPLLTEYDLHLFGQGAHREIYQKLGAHLRVVDGVPGVNFALWAPNCYKVAVIGDFNRWDPRTHCMQRTGDSGVWELFVPGIGAGERYKYEVRSHNQGYRDQKSDPFAFAAELRPKTASIVCDIDDYAWNDEDWLAARAKSDPLNQPLNIYEAHLGSWRRKDGDRFLTYRELAGELVPYLADMGYTHLELLPIAEHPLDKSWGYQVTGYYAPTSRFGTPQDFMHLVDSCHQAGIGVILDWVPAHFPKDGHGLNYFDGTHLYSHEDPRQGEHPDWGTMVFNYGRDEVRNFLVANALFWLRKYHIDGLRVDAVSSMIYLNFSRENGDWLPNEYGSHENLGALRFLREFNESAHAEAPGVITIAEEATSWSMVSRPTYIGGLGFTFKWNMGWMHDTLRYMSRDPVHRRHHHHQITFALLYAFSENFVLPLSHDEVVHLKGSLIGKMPGDYWQKFAGLRLLFGYQYTQVGKLLNFMGGEFAQLAEWSEARSLDWHLLEHEKHAQMQRWVGDLNRLYRAQPALWQRDVEPGGFRWINADDADYSVYSYIRYGDEPGEFLVVALNCTPVPREDYRIGVPQAGFYAELLNSDASDYGGSGVGNHGGLHSDDFANNGLPYSLKLTLPPLGILILKRDDGIFHQP